MHENTPPVLQVSGSRATITLNRPAYRNRLHNEDLRTLMAHCETINAQSQIQVVVLTSCTADQAKPVFCAGFHVGEFDGEEPVVPFENLPDAIESLRPVTLCAMGGSVYGGATDVGLACDFRLGVQGMELKMPAAALGLHYYPSGLARYVSRLGLAASKRAFLTAQTVSATELLDMGYLDELLPAKDLNAAVDRWAGWIESLAPLALEGMKLSLNALARTGASSETLRLIRAQEQRSASSEDFAEGRLAFAEKRPPRFQRR